MNEAHTQLKLFAAGPKATGVIAIGVNARGVVAVGVNAVGVIAVGLNAMGSVAAVGGNCVAPVAVSLVNSVGLLAWSGVNAIGGMGQGGVNAWTHPWLGLPLVVTAIWIASRWRGRWAEPFAGIRLAPLMDLVAGAPQPTWARVRLFATGDDRVLVGDADGQHALCASAVLRRRAEAIRRKKGGQALIRIDVDQSVEADTPDGYRRAPHRVAVASLAEIRALPRAARWPRDEGELEWLQSRALVVASLLCAVACVAWPWLP